MTDHENRVANVTNRLRSDDALWQTTPEYQRFERSHMHNKVNQVFESVMAEGSSDLSRVQSDYESTLDFVDRSFDMREGLTKPEGDIGRVFAVPVRTERGDERYESEVYPFVPLLRSEYGVSADIRQRTLVGLPPLILDTYDASPNSDLRGAVVLTPLFTDMTSDLTPTGSDKEVTNLINTVLENINETARFSQEVLGAKVMGLGAVIPSLTDFGRAINQEGLVTTTGHAGTVHLIVETARKVIWEKGAEINARIGIIGAAGSIGYSSLDTVAELLPDFEIIAQDRNEERLQALVADYESKSHISIESNALDVLRNSDVILTAITGRIDLDKDDPNFELDLSGKYIIDDSQPGCFEREQIEARGGKLLWVVGEDGSDEGFLTRKNGYNFGDEAGIMGRRAIWGCEAEAGVIAASKDYEKALRQRVEPRHVRAIGELCARYNVEIAPFQAYGQPVHLG